MCFVYREMPCRVCGQWLSSDEKEWAAHVLDTHGFHPGDAVTLALYPDFSRTRPVLVEEVEAEWRN